MYNKITPLEIDGIAESIYAGFWTRLGSILLDFLILLPIITVILYLNGLGKNIYFFTLIPNILLQIWYNIYLPKKYGGSPGKLAVGIRIIRLDGQPIGWKEAILRNAVSLALTILSSLVMTSCLLKADDAIFRSLGWMQRSRYLMSLSPDFFTLNTWVTNIWVYGELIVLLTNKRKRAIHDFIAGTVIVKARYIDKIRDIMYSTDNNLDKTLSKDILSDFATE
jgi:uncharacterized RDD family membrane protein YckC